MITDSCQRWSPRVPTSWYSYPSLWEGVRARDLLLTKSIRQSNEIPRLSCTTKDCDLALAGFLFLFLLSLYTLIVLLKKKKKNPAMLEIWVVPESWGASANTVEAARLPHQQPGRNCLLGPAPGETWRHSPPSILERRL